MRLITLRDEIGNIYKSKKKPTSWVINRVKLIFLFYKMIKIYKKTSYNQLNDTINEKPNIKIYN